MAASAPSSVAPSTRPVVRLRPGRQGRVLHGHPWIYSNEIEMDAAAKGLPAGSIVRIERHNGGPVGTAMFHPHTLIAARMLTRDPHAAVDAAFLRDKIERSLEIRERLFSAPFYRLIHAEADELPGLVIDRYGDILAVQANTAGMDRLLPELVPVLEEVLHPKAIALRNESPARTLEGLGAESRWALGGESGPVRVEEGGATFFADVMAGQKTGWFYDQRDNRAFVASLAKGARVLDAYTHTGGFAVQCAKAGAAEVLGIDRSEPALDLASRAAKESGIGARTQFRRADVFAELETMGAGQDRFELVIADPPAFVKSKRELESGLRGYRKLTRLAASVVAPRGTLAIALWLHDAIARVPRGATTDAARRVSLR